MNNPLPPTTTELNLSSEERLAVNILKRDPRVPASFEVLGVAKACPLKVQEARRIFGSGAIGLVFVLILFFPLVILVFLLAICEVNNYKRNRDLIGRHLHQDTDKEVYIWGRGGYATVGDSYVRWNPVTYQVHVGIYTDFVTPFCECGAQGKKSMKYELGILRIFQPYNEQGVRIRYNERDRVTAFDIRQTQVWFLGDDLTRVQGLVKIQAQPQARIAEHVEQQQAMMQAMMNPQMQGMMNPQMQAMMMNYQQMMTNPQMQAMMMNYQEMTANPQMQGMMMNNQRNNAVDE